MATLIHDADRMSSLEIAELTGKRHDAILRDIRNLLKQGVSHHNFVETSYKQPQPRGGYKELPCFELTKKGCLILASGYDAVLREKIIDRWEQLELEKRKPQTPQTYLEALKALVSSEEEKQRLALEKQQLEQQNAKLQPKAAFADAAFKKIRFSFGSMESLRIFVVLQIIIYYAQGIFYAQKASILKIYREVVSVYHSLWRMIVCSKIGYGFSFFITNK